MRKRRAVDWLAAGRNALQRGGWRDAKAAFQNAEPTAEALEGLGWSLYWLNAMEEALAVREKAYRAYLDRGDRAAAARVAIGLAVASVDIAGPAVATGWLERARNHLRRTQSAPIHGWLAFYEGHVLRIEADDFRGARKLARRAARIASHHDEPQLELLCRALEGLTLVNEGKVSEGMRRIDEATTAAMAGEMRDLDSVAQTCCMLLYACERVRDYKRAAQWQKRIAHFCREWEIEPLFAVCATQHAAMLVGSGNWRDAEAELEATLQRLEESRPLLVPDVIVQLGELRRRQGRYDEALALLRRAESRTEAMLTRAAIALDSDDPAAAIEFAERLLGRKSGEKWVERATALQIIVTASLQNDDAARARKALADLQKIAHTVDAPIIHAIERRAAGDAAVAAGAPEDARAAYVESVDQFQRVQAPFEAAVTQVLLVRILFGLGRDTAAQRELDRALEVFEALGAAREIEKARDSRQRKSVNDHPLTQRETEVLHLIADGLGDKQLAAKLSLSEHTVHRHVSNILRKLGAGSRSAAVAQAVRSGWL